MAATQAQKLRKDNSAYRAQSSHHSTRPQGDDEEEVNQSDLRDQLNQQDLRQHINNRHCQCDTAERERRHQYDEEHDASDADY